MPHPKYYVKLDKNGNKKYNLIFYCNYFSYHDFYFKNGHICFECTYDKNGCKIHLLIKWNKKYMYQLFNTKFENLSVRGDALKFNVKLNAPYIIKEADKCKNYSFKESLPNISYVCKIEGNLCDMLPKKPKQYKWHYHSNNSKRYRPIYTASSYYIQYPYCGGSCTPR